MVPPSECGKNRTPAPPPGNRTPLRREMATRHNRTPSRSGDGRGLGRGPIGPTIGSGRSNPTSPNPPSERDGAAVPRAAGASRSGDAKANLGTQFKRTIKQAGLELWPKPFHNLRAIRQTELSSRFAELFHSHLKQGAPALAGPPDRRPPGGVHALEPVEDARGLRPGPRPPRRPPRPPRPGGVRLSRANGPASPPAGVGGRVPQGGIWTGPRRLARRGHRISNSDRTDRRLRDLVATFPRRARISH
ncbi:hypothetical protein CA12_11200 [Alienimonas californiensis]|uniref:Uncharacterized protein n=1 Tax=Alienimonas californiensis TaxID=2527989 RepID=A0A517P6M7_9PLAN|nr:hypothetical protein CA12_11200 [Alienimonas californiensis]